MTQHVGDVLERELIAYGEVLGMYRRDDHGHLVCYDPSCTRPPVLPGNLCEWHKAVGLPETKKPEHDHQRAFRLRVDRVMESMTRAGRNPVRSEVEQLVREQLRKGKGARP